MIKNNFKKSITAIIILISISTVFYFVTAKNVDQLKSSVVDSIATSGDSEANSSITKIKPSISTVTPSVTPIVTNNPTIIDAKNYNLDITGLTDSSAQFQKMMDSFPSGSSIKLPKGTYKLLSIVKLKDNITLIASNNVIVKGIGYTTLFSTGNDNSFQGIEFQNCATAISVFHKNGLKVINCRFTNNIRVFSN